MGENYFQVLYDVDVRNKIKKKNKQDNLAYIAWSSSWAEVKKRYPTATYEVKKFGDNQLPYIYDDATGYMVFTSVTIEGITHDMHYPVLNGANKAMKKEAYTYTVTYKEKTTDKTVEAATMFDINTAIMRCLTKNVAMHGLALYVYEGEELPEEVKNVMRLQAECWELFVNKAKLSDTAKAKANELCKAADAEANGDPRLIEDLDVLETLKKQLLAVRK